MIPFKKQIFLGLFFLSSILVANESEKTQTDETKKSLEKISSTSTEDKKDKKDTKKYFLHEITGEPTASFKAYTGSAATSLFHLNLGYSYLLIAPMQLTANLEFQTSGSASIFQFLLGATLNYPFKEKLEKAFFATVSLGFSKTSGGKTDFVMRALAGKRFEILPRIYYRPNASITIPFGGSFVFGISPLDFSLSL